MRDTYQMFQYDIKTDSIYNRFGQTQPFNDPAAILDKDSGVVIKIGSAIDMLEYYNALLQTEMGSSFSMYVFGMFFRHQSCTILNYLLNGTGDKNLTFLALSKEEMSEKIIHLQLLGF